MARPLPDVMYGTPDGVALDQGAAESVRRLRPTSAPPLNPGVTPAMRPGGSPEAAAFRESLRTVGPAPTAPVAPTAPTAAAKPGVLSRATTGLRNAPGAILEADLAPLAKGVGGAAKNLISGVVGKTALGLGVADAAHTAYNTDTDTYAQRTGIEREATHVPQFAKDLGIRALGTAQDIGNTLTFGLADRVGNLAAGNGFNRSAGNQVGEVFGPGREVGGLTPAPTAPPSIREPFSDVRNGTYGDGMPDLTGKIVRDGNSYSGKDVKFGAEIVNPRNPGVGVSSLDTSEGYRQNLLELQRNAANAQAPGGVNGIGRSGGGNVFDDLRAKNPTVPATRAERMAQAELANRAQIAEAQTGATLRGQDITAGTSRANTRDVTSATLRGQDMDYAEKMDAKRMDIAARMADRKLRGDIFQASGGNLTKAAEIAAANGVDPASFISAGAASQTQGEKADAAGRGMFKDLFNTPGKDGKMESRPDLEAQAYASVMQQTGNKFGALPKEQQTALMTESVARVRELESARSRQNGTFGQSWLGHPNEATLDSLPTTEQNAGSKLRHANPWDAFNSNVQMNDVLQTLPDGRTIARDPKLMTQSRLKQLEEQGARWEK
jgi:hypothetical protein